jgi:integrase
VSRPTDLAALVRPRPLTLARATSGRHAAAPESEFFIGSAALDHVVIGKTGTRATFSPDQERAIFAQNDRRDRVALHLLLKAGIRKGALQGVQFRHFDHAQRRLTVFTKGGKVQKVPIVDPAFWNELERYILDWGAQPNEYLLYGNLKAVQKLLGHSSISTTGDIYTDSDIDQLSSWRRRCVGCSRAKGESFPPGPDEIPANRGFMRLAGIEPATSRSGGARSIP